MSLNLYRASHSIHEPAIPLRGNLGAVKANTSRDANAINVSKSNGWNAPPVDQVQPIRHSKFVPNTSSDGAQLSKKKVLAAPAKTSMKLRSATAHPKPAAEVELSSRRPAKNSTLPADTARSGQTTHPHRDPGTSAQSDALLAARGVPRSLSTEQTRLANTAGLRMSLGPRDAGETSGDARWRELLADTGYLDESGMPTKQAQSRLKQARQRLAADLQLNTREITRNAAAAYVAREHWTARAGTDPAALARAQAAQEAENRLLQPQRQAYAQWQDTQRQYQDTVALIRGLRPDFDEALILRQQVGESTIGQLAASTAPTDPTMAALRLNVAKQLLEHFESAAQGSNDALQARITAFKQDVGSEQVVRWKQQLVGSGTSLDTLLRVQADRTPLDTESVDRLVAEHAPVIRPQRAFGGTLLGSNSQTDRFYLLNESTPEDLALNLGAALRAHPNAMMQISTTDGTGQWQIYRHEGLGSNVIDANTNELLPLATDGNHLDSIKHTILQALQQTQGDESVTSLVVSYANPHDPNSPVLRVKQNPGFWTKQTVNEFMDAWSANPAALRAAMQDLNSPLRRRFSNITAAEVAGLRQAIEALPATDPRKAVLVQRIVEPVRLAEQQSIESFMRNKQARAIASDLVDTVSGTSRIGALRRARIIDLVLEQANEQGVPLHAFANQLKIPAQLSEPGDANALDTLIIGQNLSIAEMQRSINNVGAGGIAAAANISYMLAGSAQNHLDSLADPDGARMRNIISDLNQSNAGSKKQRSYDVTYALRSVYDQIESAWEDNVRSIEPYQPRPDFSETVGLIREHADDPSTLIGEIRTKPYLAHQYGERENSKMFSADRLAILQDQAAALDLFKRIEQHPGQRAEHLAQVNDRRAQILQILQAMPMSYAARSDVDALREELVALQFFGTQLREQLAQP
jgi:hypothetical protein